MVYSRIIGTGSYLPATILTNADLVSKIDTTDKWIVTRTGIRQRHIAQPSELTSDLACHAAKQAITSSGLSTSQVDLIIVATTTPDVVFPSTACFLQNKLGMAGCPAFDVQAVCSGFIYALSIADQFIRSGQSQCVLVVGAEIFSRITDWTDRSNCILWGDGAGAVVVQASSTPGIISTHLHADGDYTQLLHVPGGVHAHDTRSVIEMEGNAVFRFAVNTLDSIVDETLQANSLDKGSIDWLVPHQANIRIIQATAKKLGMPMEKVVVTIDSHANTSAASIPLALDMAVRDGRIQKGHTVLMEAFGGGFTWGSVLLKY